MTFLSVSKQSRIKRAYKCQPSQALSITTAVRCVVLTAVISGEPLPSYTFSIHQKNKDSILAIAISMNLLGLKILFTGAHSSYISAEDYKLE